MPVLDDALYFSGEPSKLRVVDRPQPDGLASGQSYTIRLKVTGVQGVRAVLVWTDPPSTAAANALPTFGGTSGGESSR